MPCHPLGGIGDRLQRLLDRAAQGGAVGRECRRRDPHRLRRVPGASGGRSQALVHPFRERQAIPIRIVGVSGPNGEMPAFDAGVPEGGLASDYAVERGIFYIWNYTNNYVVENLEFRNARGQDYFSNNAAAAYINGTNITFRNCYSHHNDNGWFSTTSARHTVLDDCETAYNGKLEGGDMTHNHYMASQSLTVRGCYIHDSTEAQNFKSRAKSVVFEYNWVEDAANYEWELASDNTSNSLLIGNVIIKRPGSGNRRIVQLSDGTAADATSGTLTLINNTIISTGRRATRYVTSINVATANVVLYNNVFAGPSTTLFDWHGTAGSRAGSNNWMPTGTACRPGPSPAASSGRTRGSSTGGKGLPPAGLVAGAECRTGQPPVADRDGRLGSPRAGQGVSGGGPDEGTPRGRDAGHRRVRRAALGGGYQQRRRGGRGGPALSRGRTSG